MASEAATVLRTKLDTAIAAHDRAAAVSVVHEAIRSKAVTIDELYGAVLTPLLTDVGEAWSLGTTAVWQEHFTSAVVRTIIESLAVDVAAASAPATDRCAVLACPSGEQHDLGLRMLTDRLLLKGWSAYFLGADTPAEEIAAAATALDADTVVLSAATHYNLVLLRRFVDDLRATLPGVRVGIGGPALSCHHDWPAEDLLLPHDLGLDDEPSGACPLPDQES